CWAIIKRRAMKPFAVAAVSIVVFPALLAASAVVVFSSALFGIEPLWSEPQLTMAEAAALKDRATMQRLIWNGVDPNASARVRPDILKSYAIVVTPLEASVGTRTPTAMQFLLMRGARMDSRERAVIMCLAIKDDAREIVEFLEHDDVKESPD